MDMITSGRVVLRPVQPGDLDVLYRLISDLGSWAMRTPHPPRTMTRANFESSYVRRLADDDSVEFAITVDGELIGRCGLFSFDVLAHHAEIGIGLLPEWTGKGYGTEALRGLIRFGFQDRNLHRIGLGAAATNAGALASYRKLGFVEEGRLREHGFIDGAWVDEVCMGLLRSEWVTAAARRLARFRPA